MQKNSREISPVKQRILQYVEILGISNYKFYALSGIAYGSLSKPGGITDEGLVRILTRFPKLNPEWVLLGTGQTEKTISTEIVCNDSVVTNAYKNAYKFDSKQKVHKSYALTEESQMNKYSSDTAKLYIPYLPSRTFSFITTHPDLSEFETYRIPGLRNADFLMPYYGDDMHPTVSAGNIIAGKIVKKAPLYTWGRVHLFELEEVGVVMGRLRPGSSGDSVRCEPENPSFQAIEFPIENIIAIAMLMAVIKIL
jgi:hypothetical protein